MNGRAKTEVASSRTIFQIDGARKTHPILGGQAVNSWLVALPDIENWRIGTCPVWASYVQMDDFRMRRHKDVTYWTSAPARRGVAQTFGSACVRTAMR